MKKSRRNSHANEALRRDAANADVLFAEQGIVVIDSSLGVGSEVHRPTGHGRRRKEADDDGRR